MTTAGGLCLVGTVASPMLGAGAMALLRDRRQEGARLSAGLHWLGMALAGLLVILVAIHGTIDIGIQSGGSVIVGLSANHLTVTLIVLVLGIGAVVAVWRDLFAAVKSLSAYAFPAELPFLPTALGRDLLTKYTIGIEGSLIMLAAGAIMGLRVAASQLARRRKRRYPAQSSGRTIWPDPAVAGH